MQCTRHLLWKFVVTHIPHPYSDKMAEKSEVVVLDVLHKNETKSSDMVHIMREMASYLGSIIQPRSSYRG